MRAAAWRLWPAFFKTLVWRAFGDEKRGQPAPIRNYFHATRMLHGLRKGRAHIARAFATTDNKINPFLPSRISLGYTTGSGLQPSQTPDIVCPVQTNETGLCAKQAPSDVTEPKQKHCSRRGIHAVFYIPIIPAIHRNNAYPRNG
jgi:hypothetical protein